ncbi:MAG: FtsX-like permease family protein [Bacilli bacterium]|nr:FtsX-like permease family protein [Bacilli bacterium]
MYIFKYAYLSVTRNKGRNILIGLIIMAITISACIALTINKSGENLVNTYINSNKLEITFNMDTGIYRNATDEEKETYTPITIEDVINYGDSSYVSDYYYTLTSSLESDDIETVSYDEMFQMPDDRETDSTSSTDTSNRPSFGGGTTGFSFVAYSNQGYNENFVDGTNKITSGEMFDNDSTENVVVISSDLADENNLEVGDTITFYSSTDDTITYEFTVVGIYEDSSTIESTSGMGQNNSRNTIYIPLSIAKTILANEDDSVTNKGLSAKFYLNNNDDLDAFETEVREKGLSDVYTVSTNEDEITSTLEHIKNMSKFSKSFLIVVLIIGAIILSIINILNIRERKYEIGVSRAIGMTKSKITLQLVAEMMIVSLAALIVGTTIGVATSQPITNSILASEISSYQTESTQISENFGGKNFGTNTQRGGSFTKNIDYVDSLKVTVSAITILQLFLISIFLTTVSGIIAITFINQYEPNKILQNRT